MRGLILKAMLAICVLTGCSSFWRTTDTQTPAPEVIVEVDEPKVEIPSLPKGCVATIEEFELPYHVKPDDERLLADRLIVVRKEARRIMLFSGGQLRHDRPGDTPDCWHIGLGSSPVFDKLMEGDGRTPEGFYLTGDKPWSNFHGAILVHYPSKRHANAALARNLITKSTRDQIVSAHKNGSPPPQNTALGGDILIHGGGSSSDWTLGCIAMRDYNIDELRSLLPKDMKTWILILP